MKVYKFGGASIKNASGVKRLIKIVEHTDGNLMVVVSAMGKTTNALERITEFAFAQNKELALRQLDDLREYHYQLIAELYPEGHRFLQLKIEALLQQILDLINHPLSDYDCYYDQIVSYGELMSSRIVSVALCKAGLDCEYLDITSVLKTDDCYRSAQPDILQSEELLNNFISEHKAKLYLTQGFIGSAKNGYRTTLGREGSDYTAALLAYMLNAESVTIWKDVAGVLNADPKVMPDAVLIEQMSYYEAVELAHSGAQVIHPKTIRPLENKSIPLYVKPYDNPTANGTVICANADKLISVPVFIWKRQQVLVTIRPKDFSFVLEEGLNRVFEIINRYHLQCALIQSSAVTISVCLTDNRHLEEAFAELERLYKVSYNKDLSILTIRKCTKDILQQQSQGQQILLTQTTRNTARIVVKNKV